MPDKNLDRERILVCVSASPTSSDVIRRAAKLSKSTGAELIALYVEDSESQDDAQEKTVHGHLNMAERLGAVITTVYGNDPATAIAQYARVSGITKIVLGKSPGKRSFFAREETLMSRLNELAPDVEIIIVPNHLQEDARHFSLRRKLLKEQFTMGDLVRTVLILVLCTGVGFLFSAIGLAITNVVLIYILGVMAVALFTTGYIYSLLSSLLSVLIFNFFFTEPYYSLQSSPDYFATFAVMFAVAILSSSLTSRIKTQSIQTANKAYQTEVLLSTSQLLQKAEDKEAILNVMLQQLCRLLEHSVLYYGRTDGILAEQPVLHEIESDHGFSQVDFPAERDVVEWVGRNGKHAGRSTRKWPQARCLYMAIRGENRVWAVVGIRADNSPSIDEYRKNLMISILDECALALEKDHMTREKQRIEENARQEALRANLLRAISHDLRTPLTSISGNAAILLEDLGDLDDSRKKALYASIYDDAIWLNGLMENLLTITRTENETVKLNLQSEMVSDAIEEALRHLDRNAARRRIVVTLEDDLLMARMDSALIVQVLINLINNAVKYTPENAGITIGAKPEGNMVVLWVEDEGPGIPEGDEEKVFELFYTGVKRSPDSRRGIGLGLALCRSIVQAHGGEIKVSNIQPHGARFEFTLPIAEVEEYEQ
ncbi:MAG: sensor histidine kinase KdpD [Clostridia bacterium]|nr:sensor histidine kinase KdpD [Clostridia bacterium]